MGKKKKKKKKKEREFSLYTCKGRFQKNRFAYYHVIDGNTV